MFTYRRYININPIRFQIGDIVEISIGFYCVQIRGGKMKLMSSLKSITMLNDTIRQVQYSLKEILIFYINYFFTLYPTGSTRQSSKRFAHTEGYDCTSQTSIYWNWGRNWYIWKACSDGSDVDKFTIAMFQIESVQQTFLYIQEIVHLKYIYYSCCSQCVILGCRYGHWTQKDGSWESTYFYKGGPT